MILTDEDIKAIYDNEKGGDYYDTVWAIEAAILEKLSSSEPVCWADLKTLQRMQVPQLSRVAFQTYLRATEVDEGSIPLFTHPLAPVSVEPVAVVRREGERSDGKQWHKGIFDESGECDLDDGTELFTHPPAPSAAREEIQRLRRIIDEEAKDSAQVIIERDKLLTLCDQMGEVLDEAVTYCEGPQWSPSMASECYKALTAWREMKK